MELTVHNRSRLIVVAAVVAAAVVSLTNDDGDCYCCPDLK